MPMIKVIIIGLNKGNEDLIDEASQDQESREPQSSAEAKGIYISYIMERQRT